MNETVEGRTERVMRVVDAARAVAADPSIVRPLTKSTGLSREGVELALREHLEMNPTDGEVRTLVERASEASHVHVILSANVFTGALRALAVAVATAPTVSVHISSREPVFAKRLIAAIADPAIFTADPDAIEQRTEGEIHVYGRADTIASVRARAASGVVVRGHGPGFGIACIMQQDDLAVTATALAQDIVPFDQRGCLSPRVAFAVSDDPSTALRFAESLAIALEEAPVSRGTLTEEEKSERTRYTETVRVAGDVVTGSSFAIGVSTGVILPPTGRHLHVVPIRDLRDVDRMLGHASQLVTAVGSSEREIASFFPRSIRTSAIGKMQKPPLDGPVDLRLL